MLHEEFIPASIHVTSRNSKMKEYINREHETMKADEHQGMNFRKEAIKPRALNHLHLSFHLPTRKTSCDTLPKRKMDLLDFARTSKVWGQAGQHMW